MSAKWLADYPLARPLGDDLWLIVYELTGGRGRVAVASEWNATHEAY